MSIKVAQIWFHWKLKILAPLLKLPKNVGNLGKFIVEKGIKKSPKVQKIANSGHTGQKQQIIIKKDDNTRAVKFVIMDRWGEDPWPIL